MEVKSAGQVKIAMIVVRFDAYTAQEVEDALKNLVGEGCRGLVCNLSQTEYVSSAGLRVLLATAKALQRCSGKMAICCLRPYVKEVLETAGFTRIFKVYETEKEAVEGVS